MEIDWPFRGAEALATGALSVRALRRHYVAVYPGVYAPRWMDLSAVQRAHAAYLWSKRTGVIAGLSASAMHGAKWIEGTAPAELRHSIDDLRPC